MARKRQIDPGIWASEQFISLSPLARLLFIGTISQSDDEGRLKASPQYLKCIIFPGDLCTPEQILEWRKEISDAGLITVYSVNDTEYLLLPSWKKYQYINHKFPSLIPAPLREQYGNSTVPLPPIGIGIGIGTSTGSGIGKDNVFTLYENLCGSLNPIVADELKLAEKEYPPEWITNAFKEAADLNKRSWRYVETILKRWQVEGKANKQPTVSRYKEL